MYLYVICDVVVCHSHVTHISFVCHLYVLAFIRIPFIVLVCHLYVTLKYSYVTPISLVCTRMSFLCHSKYLHIICMSCIYSYVIYITHTCSYVARMYSYALACYSCVTRVYPYVARMSFYYELLTNVYTQMPLFTRVSVLE